MSPHLRDIVEFLLLWYKAGLGYSCLNTARSALSSVLTPQGNVSIGNHPLIHRFMKGVFENRPSLPSYTHYWDVNIVLKFLQSLPQTAGIEGVNPKVGYITDYLIWAEMPNY